MTFKNKQMELAKQIQKFSSGVSLILNAMSYVTERGLVLESIINKGDYVTTRYQDCFNYSFDEEVAQILNFSSALSTDLNYQIPTPQDTVALNEYETCVLGLNISNRALEEVVNICREDSQIEKDLVDFIPKSIDEDEYSDYNPFNLYGVMVFQNKFKGFKEAYLSELRAEIGNIEFTKIHKKINSYFLNSENLKFKVDTK